MFPQSELDNYKLQVELLQEKLQRSEISRQHLEHKLDKILHKRDEHDKVVRSKAKHKYEQFLEEQQRRNERNKQLVQMLERIEQQTEAMNARSERLKMMKLQYEMYFAKLVHSQTRRCIQSSVPSNVTPIMPTTFSRSITQTMTPTQQAQQDIRMEGYNYTNTMNPQLMTTSYQRYPVQNMENEQIFKPQYDNPTLQNLEMPTSNCPTPGRIDYMQFRNINNNSSNQNQEQYAYQPIPTLRDFVQNQSDNSYVRMERDPTLYTSSPVTNENKPLPTTTSLLPKDKLLTEPEKASTISTTSSITFDRLPNVNMQPQLSNNITESSNSSEIQLSNKNNEIHLRPNNGTNNLITSPQETSSDLNSSSLIPQELKQIPNKVNTNVKETKPLEIAQSIIHDNKSNSYEIDQLKPIEQVTETSSDEFKADVNISAKTAFPTEQIISSNTISNNPSDINSITTPVSIENIENAIYGELLTPIETSVEQLQENSNVAPKLLENLVTQPENLELKNIPLEESKTDLQQYVPDTVTTNVGDEKPSNDYETQPDEQNYDQTLAYDYNNTQQEEATTENNANEYSGYGNVDNTAVDETQQQQQYDYSNYDPSQYSYPGYIYDETTGEYKPDPNAPAEQYATDQQYAAEGYDQQQYQQQEGYDYNQYETQETTSTNADNTTYENYDTAQQENVSNPTELEDNTTQNQAQAEPATTVNEPPTEPVPDEVTQTPATTTKPTSILSTTEKNEAQKKKKRVNFVDSSETDESAADKAAVPAPKLATGNAAASSESDFDFSSSTETVTKPT